MSSQPSPSQASLLLCASVGSLPESNPLREVGQGKLMRRRVLFGFHANEPTMRWDGCRGWKAPDTANRVPGTSATPENSFEQA